MEWSCRLFLIIFLHLSVNSIHSLIADPLSNENSISSYIKSQLNARVVRSPVIFSATPQPPPVDLSKPPEASAPLIPDSTSNSSALITAERVLNCNHISNGLVGQYRDTLYLLSANQLFVVNVQVDKTELSTVATFEPFTENATQFSVHPWTADENQLVVAIAFRTHYNVYRFVGAPRDDDGASFNRKQIVRQKIAIVGRSTTVRLFSDNDVLYLLLVDNTAHGRSSVSIYEYRHDYFREANTVTSSAIDAIDVEFFEDGPLITAVQYCREHCQQTVIEIYDMNLKKLQKMFTIANFVGLIKHDSEPRLVACMEEDCMVYFFQERHFLNPFPIPFKFRIAELVTKRRRVVMRSEDNTLYMYTRREMEHSATLKLTGLFGRSKLHAIATPFNKIYAVISSINETSSTFNFYNIKNDSELLLGQAQDRGPNGRDPFEEIESCANRLKSQLDTSFAMITKINAILPNILRVDEEARIKKITVVNSSVEINESVTVEEIDLISDEQFGNKSVLDEMLVLQDRFREAERQAKKQTENFVGDPFDGLDTKAGETSASQLTAQTIRVKNLKTKSPIFNNLITKSGRNSIKGHLTVNTLTSPGIQIQSGLVNDIPLNDLYNRKTNSTILGNTSLRQLTVDNLHIKNSLNGVDMNRLKELDKNAENTKELQLQTIRTKNLTVNFINGVDINKFLRDSYLSTSSDKIQGNLIFTTPLTIRNNLQAAKFNSLPTSDYLTLTTDQEIGRKVIFRNFFAHHLKADQINGIEFGKVAVVQGERNTIETPVRIENMVIKQKLTLSEQENRQMAQHIVGTRVEDLFQSYTGKVVIKGNLILHNLTLEMAKNLFLNESPFPLNSLANYWTRNTHQKFERISLKGRVETSQLLSERVNGHAAHSFVTTHQEILQTDSQLHFNDAVVNRNIRTNGVSRILELSRNAVRRGETAVIEGLKHFENITAHQMITSFVNDQQMSNLFLNISPIISCDHKIYFDELYLHTDLKCPSNNLHVDTIDGVNMQSLIADTVYIDLPTELVSIEIDQFETDGDLYVENLNGVNTQDALERLDSMQFVVNVTGRANVERILVDHINGIHVKDYFQLLVRTDRGGPQELGGTKKFLQGLAVQRNFHVKQLSGLDVQRWMRNVLRTDENYVITEEWVFKDVQVENLYSKAINGVPTDLLIDARSNIILDQDLHVNQMAVINGKIVAVGAHNWTRIINNLQNPLPRDWDRVTVTGDVQMPEGGSKLWELITYGVNNRNPQSFTKEINFLGHTRVRKLTPHKSRINEIDLEAVITDTLRNDVPDGQIVTGAIVFENGIDVAHLRASQLDVVYINDINMQHLNDSLWRPHSHHPISFPQLQFPQRITVDKLRVNGSINGVFSDRLGTIDHVAIENVELLQEIVVRGNVTIDFINSTPFAYILEEHGRLTTQKRQRFTGALSFEDLIIQGASSIHSINGISIDSLLLSKSEKMQEVSGLKTFNNVYFSGPSNINSLNNVRLFDMYKDTVNKHLNQKLDRLNVKQIIAEKGLEIRESLNDIPIDYFQTNKITLPDIRQMETQIRSIIASDYATRKRQRRFNYFDYAHNFEVISGGNDSSHIILKRYAQSDCKSSQKRCLCKRQVEIQMSKFDEIHIHRSSSNITSRLEVGDNEITISNENSCDPLKAFGYLQFSRKGHRVAVKLNGSSNLIGSLVNGEGDPNLFITETQLKDNYTIAIWQLPENEPTITIIRTLVYGNMQKATAHLMVHNSTYLLIVSVAFNQPKYNLLWVYRFIPDEKRFKIQHVLRINYDLFASLTTDKEGSYLVGAQSGTRSMDIYKIYYSTINDTYQLSARTKIPFDYPLKDVIAFAVHDQLFIAALLENGHLIIYRYHYAQGWLQESFGNFQQIENVEKLSIIQNPVDFTDYLVVSGAKSTAALISIN